MRRRSKGRVCVASPVRGRGVIRALVVGIVLGLMLSALVETVFVRGLA